MSSIGKLTRIAGPVVVGTGINPKMYDVVRVGKEKLMGEVIEIGENNFTVQVYEDTSGIKPGEPIENTGKPLSVTLGPGLLEGIYDGIQRSLPVLADEMGEYILRGVDTPGIDEKKKWKFKASVKAGDIIEPGQVIGTVQENASILHKILVPNKENYEGKIKNIKSGEFTVKEVIGVLENGIELKLSHEWPVRIPRKFKEKLTPEEPLITGQRILDALYPVAKGGVAAIPGPFGAGKTVTQQSLAKFSDAKIVVYIGCGERGNEMTEVLEKFPTLDDPKTGNKLSYRTVLIANTSITHQYYAFEECCHCDVINGNRKFIQILDTHCKTENSN